MNDKFKDPIAPRVKPKGLDYDKRSSCFVEMGSDYGSGFNQPKGSKEGSNESPIPKGCHSYKGNS